MFVPDEFRVPANATVYVRLTQQDSVDHTFTLSPEKDFVIPSTWSSPQLDAYFVGNNLTDVRLPGVPGAVAWANFTTPAEPGRYEFVCRFPGHFQGGMFGFMIVEVREVFVNLTTESFRFSPETFTVPPGAIVHARITQRDLAPHTFTVGVEKNFVIPSTFSSSQLDAYFVDNNLTDVFIPAVAETSVFVNFTAPLQPGRYEFVCRIPGHFQGGMVGFMIVSEGPPTSQGGPPLGLIPGIMLLALGSVMGFAAIYHVRAVRAAKRRK